MNLTARGSYIVAHAPQKVKYYFSDFAVKGGLTMNCRDCFFFNHCFNELYEAGVFIDNDGYTPCDDFVQDESRTDEQDI